MKCQVRIAGYIVIRISHRHIKRHIDRVAGIIPFRVIQRAQQLHARAAISFHSHLEHRITRRGGRNPPTIGISGSRQRHRQATAGHHGGHGNGRRHYLITTRLYLHRGCPLRRGAIFQTIFIQHPRRGGVHGGIPPVSNVHGRIGQGHAAVRINGRHRDSQGHQVAVQMIHRAENLQIQGHGTTGARRNIHIRRQRKTQHCLAIDPGFQGLVVGHIPLQLDAILGNRLATGIHDIGAVTNLEGHFHHRIFRGGNVHIHAVGARQVAAVLGRQFAHIQRIDNHRCRIVRIADFNTQVQVDHITVTVFRAQP